MGIGGDRGQPIYPPKRVNLRSVIQLDEIEDLFSSLCNRIDAQDKTIADLQRLCSSFLSKAEYIERAASMTATVSQIKDRVDYLQSISSVTIGEAR